MNTVKILYHGSKSGIKGNIAPCSRERCDFGKGFYMGSESSQPMTLICNYPDAFLYTLRVDMSDLGLLDLDMGLEWALFVAYHRGKMEHIRQTSLYKKMQDMEKDCDMISGYIANDRMFVVLDRFFQGMITDTALIHSLSALELGKQYVARTEKACRHITIVDKRRVSDKEKMALKIESEHQRNQGIALAEEICHKYRREGRYFDEIIKDGGL